MVRQTRRTVIYNAANQSDEYPTEKDPTVNQGHQNIVPPQVDRKIAEAFLRQHPPIFTGPGNPTKLKNGYEQWIGSFDS